MDKAVSIKVTGRVQKVGYRYYGRLAARDFHIVGRIDNLPDGSVHIIAQGEESDLQDFIDYCKKGPTWARVDSIDVQTIDLRDDLTDFE